MKELFLQILKMSLSASLIALMVIGLRLAFKRAPRAVICALWALVGIRLLIPALPSSSVSLMPQKVSEGTAVSEITERYTEKTVVIREQEPEFATILARQEQAARPVPVREEAGERYVVVSAATKEAPRTFGESVVPILAYIWAGGAVCMLLYMGFSYGKIRRKVRFSAPEGGNVFLCDEIRSPFIFGVIRPRIYLPSDLKKEERDYVLAHERAHLSRGDQLWKPLGFLFLTVYWFNPLFWLCYILLCRDIERACDEKVIRKQDDQYRKAYSMALLGCSASRRKVAACPLAFGEVSVKSRIKSVLNYRRPGFWLLLGAAFFSLIIAGCALTDPNRISQETTPSAQEETAPFTQKETAPSATEEAGPSVPEEATEPAAESDSEGFPEVIPVTVEQSFCLFGPDRPASTVSNSKDALDAFIEPVLRSQKENGYGCLTTPEGLTLQALLAKYDDDWFLSHQLFLFTAEKEEKPWKVRSFIKKSQDAFEMYIYDTSEVSAEGNWQGGRMDAWYAFCVELPPGTLQSPEQVKVTFHEKEEYWQVKRTESPAVQNAVLQADRLMRLEVADGLPNDFSYSREEGIFMLDRAGKRILYRTNTDVISKSLDFCTDPRLLAPAGNTGFYVLDADSIAAVDLWEQKSGRVSLPDGVNAGDINRFEPFLYGDGGGLIVGTDEETWLLRDGSFSRSGDLGWKIKRRDGGLTVQVRDTLWVTDRNEEDIRVINASQEELVLCVINKEARQAVIYDYEDQSGFPRSESSGIACYISTIDLSGWLYIPDRFVCSDGLYVMAPKEEGTDLYCVSPGQHSVHGEKEVTDLTAEETEILQGKIYPLTDYQAVTDDFTGFLIDLDQDGTAEKITLEAGVLPDKEIGYEWYCDDRHAGYSELSYRWNSMNLGEMDWPEESDFRKSSAFDLYLASIDGKSISIVMSNEVQTLFLDILETEGWNGASVQYARARMRAFGKSVADFVPGKPLEEYIREGWLCRPWNGDLLDLDGDGTDEAVSLFAYVYDFQYPYAEKVWAGDAEESQMNALGVSDRPEGSDYPYLYRYSQLYYAEQKGGGYQLTGELMLNGTQYLDTYRYQPETGGFIGTETAGRP